MNLRDQSDALTRIWHLEVAAQRSLGNLIDLRGEVVTVDGHPLVENALRPLDNRSPIARYDTDVATWIELHYDLGAHGADLAEFDSRLSFLAVFKRGLVAHVEVTDGVEVATFIASLVEPNFGYVYDIGLAFKTRDTTLMEFRPRNQA